MIDMEVLAARRDLLVASARCCDCRTTRAECNADSKKIMDEEGAAYRCCPQCLHVVSVKDMDTLLAEVAAGEVRSVEEVDPPPVQGPPPVSFHWLLHQGEWWQPKHGPMIKISSMTDTHRLHTIRMLQRQAVNIAFNEHARQSGWLGHPLGPSGDMSVAAFERELDDMLTRPIEWLMGCALLKALAAPLPTSGKRKRWSDLEQRAEHWSTCPRNRNLSDPCRCRVENDEPTEGPPHDDALFDPASGQGVL